jgi:hypothetical protein
MNNRLFETLEICLREIERGADLDTLLFRYPGLADELRPILESSVKATGMAAPAPSEEVIRRNRARLLQRAAKMREGKAAPPPSRRLWSVPLRRALVTLAVVVMLFVSGTGLVRASSSSLPGDNLYPVKRTWERVSLWLTFNEAIREELEFEHENERLEELNELLALGRSVEVDFAGYVTLRSADEWRVSGITVFISADTRLPDGQVLTGAAVRVRGQTVNGGVAAQRIELLPSGVKLPEVEDEDDPEIEEEGHEAEKLQNGGDSGETSGSESSAPSRTITSPEPEKISLEGTVTSIQNNLIVVNGIVMDIRSAEIIGIPGIGTLAKVEGNYDANSIFIVTKIEFRSAAPGSDNANDSSGGDNFNDNDDDRR